ncbi:hypothetical protein QR685DRAFT_576062 [Neurospora intermedia]|uniref:Uncharacterized protein n=1 Tax=Neurospora intermedia TaxID=5142 RepID=A0ABR3CYP8_NEUIN
MHLLRNALQDMTAIACLLLLRPVRSGWWRELVCSNLFWADKNHESETAQWLRREDKAQGLPIRLQLVGNRPALTEAAGAQKEPRGGGGGGGCDGGNWKYGPLSTSWSMLTCSSNGIDGGVNETAVQMMDYLYDFLTRCLSFFLGTVPWGPSGTASRKARTGTSMLAEVCVLHRACAHGGGVTALRPWISRATALCGPCTVHAKLEVRRRGVAIRSIISER